MEMTIATAMVGVVAISSSTFFHSFNRAFMRLPMAMDIRTADRAADRIVNRIQQADSSSILFTQIPPSPAAPIDRLSFERSRFDMNHPATPTLQQVVLAYDAASRTIQETITDLDPLTRVPIGTPLVQIILSGVEPPTSSTPLFSADPNADLLIVIQIMTKIGPGNQLRIMTRRVTLK